MALSKIPIRETPAWRCLSRLYTDFTREQRRPELWCRMYRKGWEADEYLDSGRHAYAHDRRTKRNRALRPNRRLHARAQDATGGAGGELGCHQGREQR